MEQSNWSVWYGTEVEGRLRGVPTLFVRDLPEGMKDVPRNWSHVWLCREYIERHGFDLAETLSAVDIMVSIELTLEMLPSVPDAVRERCHLVVALPAPGVGLLKATDTVRLDAAPYDIYTATVGALQHTVPGDYGDDNRIV